MGVRSLLETFGTEPVDHEIVVVRNEADGQWAPLERMLADLFDDQSVDVSTGDLEDVQSAVGTDDLESAIADELTSPGDSAVLLEDGDPVAASSMTGLYEAVLAINSDLFKTGARGLGEIELPDVLAGLADTRHRLRGYPLAHKEKLVLIVLSRYIEQLAWTGGSGTHRAAFQQLSRIEDEVGTHEVYRLLDRTDVDVHLSGVDDGRPTDLEATVHAGEGPGYRNSWFVVYRADERADHDRSAALVCWEVEPRVWDGAFTFDHERVVRIDERIASSL